ncbi:hypothetical protein B0T26DRAFT_679425 [Lasiosphaeria miniovina]|uniref:MARVEL domain-containing protein n=1 Tax=Lasiosphaeria miniovina TaxID=1954250 RepID=A0AA40A696_9PEZI|nr:uncharacterized protein B0T26DRAFT_679425 [Lasiosphaeria miniovina]KAK0710102.1 hypothetical protein B0T26DRAFT_679425 [Lasiosphaeria miniovina]
MQGLHLSARSLRWGQGDAAEPAATIESNEPFIAHSPLWVIIVRGIQILLTFVIVILADLLIKGKALDQNVFALVSSLFTWIMVAYVLVAEKVRSARNGYNIWAVLSLDSLMALFWLASMGANAALWATFNASCEVESRSIEKRGTIVTKKGLESMSAIAGLSGLLTQVILFIAVIVFEARAFLKSGKSNKPLGDNVLVEMKAPMLDADLAAAGVVHPQYTDEQAYQPQVYQQQAPAYPTSAYGQQQQQQQQQPTPYQAYPDPAQTQQYQHHGAPAGQPY